MPNMICAQDDREWLETDGAGGFASGTVSGIRTRRYHGLLTVATAPPTGRFMLVNGIEAHVTTPAGTSALSSQCYGGEVVHPDGYKLIEAFDTAPLPTWRFRLPDGTVVEHELFVAYGQPVVAMSWRVVGGRREGIRLSVRPLISGRDYHALHHENGAFRFDAAESSPAGRVTWQPYSSLPAIVAISSGSYAHQPTWYRNFHYQQEWLRGFDATEDLASPGSFGFELSTGEAVLIFAAQTDRPLDLRAGASARDVLAGLRERETRRRKAFASPLERAADQYLVRRGESGKTIIAGYPWFADWGRDTFISIRGLCLATGRLDDARDILLAWSKHVSVGMLPNRFPDRGEEPEYNSVDASLWYVISACEYLNAKGEGGSAKDEAKALLSAIDLILTGYMKGARHGIRMDDDGLLLSGEAGVQLTWMDARVGGWVVTPRMGKPVEIQALWLNALHLAAKHLPQFEPIGRRGTLSFRAKFWNDATGSLFDVIDDGLEPGVNDPRIRPNQVYAAGGLPLVLLDGKQARSVVDVVERKLLTPVGLRSLAPDEKGYVPRYSGNPAQRDAAYHQGTVWPYLIGPFVEAWVRVRGNTDDAKREARQRFLAPIMKHLGEAGLGHVSEIADADAPHMPRGCPFQAWSVAEPLRLDRVVL